MINDHSILMKYREHNQNLGVFDYQKLVEQLKQRETALDRLNKTVDWEIFRLPITRVYSLLFC